MDKLKYIRVQEEGGTYSSDIPLAADAENITMLNGHNLQETLGGLNVTNADDVTTQLSSLHSSVNSLNQQKVNKDEVSTYVPSVVTSWLNNNVNPTGSTVTVDKSLTVQGSAADAKSIGDYVTNPQPFLNLGSKLDRPSNLTQDGLTWVYNKNNDTYTVSGTTTGTTWVDLIQPINTNNFPNWLKKGAYYYIKFLSKKIHFIVYNYSNTSSIPQLIEIEGDKNSGILYIPNDITGILVRMWAGGGTVVNETIKMPEIYLINNMDFILKNYSAAQTDQLSTTMLYTNANDIKQFCIIQVESNSISNLPYVFNQFNSHGTLFTIPTYNHSAIQFLMTTGNQGALSNSNRIWIRKKYINVWSVWNENLSNTANAINFYGGPEGLGPEYSFSSINNIQYPGIYFISSPTQITDLPYMPGWLFHVNASMLNNDLSCQIMIPYNPNRNVIKYRIKTFDGWGDWVEVGSGSGSGTTINNSYNITTSPQITTDSNGWLQAVDTNTQSQSGKTDMTGPIMSMLNSTGYCHLGEGIFYVSGNIDMPEGSILQGCGKKTIIRLLSSVSNGYCVRIGRYNTVQNILFSGGYGEGSNEKIATSTIGTRNGIIYISDRNTSPRQMPDVKACFISNCFFENFEGSAIYSKNSGGGVQESMIVSNCYMQYCHAGINLEEYTEYHKFTNIVTYKCHYACINNGGNNVFTACTFHGTIGFQINGSKPNAAHGSVIGCTFNHIDNWNNPSDLGMGTAIKIINAQNGYIFTGCQIWYGGIDIQNSRGIVISDSLIGGGSPSISITGGTYFNSLQNCVFHASPTLNITNNNTRFINCYLDSNGSTVTPQ